MIVLIGGPLHQWDTGRKVKVIPDAGSTVYAVHFSQCGSGDALVVEPHTVDGVICADIPNIFLQEQKEIHAYEVRGNENGTETVHCSPFFVMARPKPEDYVYTETEVKRWEDMEEKLSTAVFTTPQDLTEEQKEQARENIGAASADQAGGVKSWNDLEDRPVTAQIVKSKNLINEYVTFSGGVGELSEPVTLIDGESYTCNLQGQISATAVAANGTVTVCSCTFTHGSTTVATTDYSGKISVNLVGAAYEYTVEEWYKEAIAPDWDGIKGKPDVLLAGEAVPVPETASIGQIIVVKAVDETGRPTEWEAAERYIPTALPLLADVTSTEALSVFEVTLSKRAVKRVMMQVTLPADEGTGNACYGWINGELWDAYIFGSYALGAGACKWVELEFAEGGFAKFTTSNSSGNIWSQSTINTCGKLPSIGYADSLGICFMANATTPAGTRIQVWGE